MIEPAKRLCMSCQVVPASIKTYNVRGMPHWRCASCAAKRTDSWIVKPKKFEPKGFSNAKPNPIKG